VRSIMSLLWRFNK